VVEKWVRGAGRVVDLRPAAVTTLARGVEENALRAVDVLVAEEESFQPPKE
jgi:hypothetical protein